MEPGLAISNDRIAAHLDADQGGRIGQLWFDGTPLLIGRDDVPDDMLEPDGSVAATDWGSYPMVPWAGRIRRGRFSFRGREHQLPINFGRHAIHGVGFSSPWSVSVADEHRVRMELELPADERWPFGGRATQDISLGPDHVLLEMEVTAGEHAFPVSFGWHPWFRKPSRLAFQPSAMYRRDEDGITVDELVAVSPGPWDDCFVNTAPVTTTIDGIDLRLTSDCDHWVVYDERAHATCIEAQTGPPDAFNIAPHVLEPGEAHRARFRIALVTP